MLVSQHAIDKYIELRKGNDRDKAVTNILHMFDKAEKEEMHAGLVKRIIDNNFIDAEYYIYEELRIVVCKNKIVTIELNFGKRRNGIDGRVRYKGKLREKRKRKFAYKKSKGRNYK